ncbi:hypothetical protein WJX79_007228 [Trebouxia sp. C0005]
MPSPPSSFSLWLARRWPALTHVSITDLCSNTSSPLENILATCTSAISGLISGPEINLCLGSQWWTPQRRLPLAARVTSLCVSPSSAKQDVEILQLFPSIDPGREHWAATRFAELYTADMLAFDV